MILHLEMKIRQLRRMRSYIQDYIAEQLDLSVRAYSDIEAGKNQLAITRLNDIGRVPGMDFLEILEFDELQIFQNSEQGNYFCG